MRNRIKFLLSIVQLMGELVEVLKRLESYRVCSFFKLFCSVPHLKYVNVFTKTLSCRYVIICFDKQCVLLLRKWRLRQSLSLKPRCFHPPRLTGKQQRDCQGVKPSFIFPQISLSRKYEVLVKRVNCIWIYLKVYLFFHIQNKNICKYFNGLPT